MPTITLGFVNVGAAGGWQSISGALTTGGAEATLPSGAANGWLIAFALAGEIPSGRIDSITARAVSSAGPEDPVVVDPGNPGTKVRTIEIAVTVDGWSPFAPSVRAAFARGATLSTSVTGVAREQAASPVFGVMVRRGSAADEDLNSGRYVDRIEVEIAYSVVGAVMPTPEPRVQGNQKYAYGLEATPGAVQAPDTLMRHAVLNMRPAPEYQDLDTYGQFVNDGSALIYEASVGELTGNVDYNELLLWLSMSAGKGAHEEQVVGSVYRHEGSIDTRKRTDFRTVSLQKGDENISERFAYVALRSLTLSGDKRRLQLGGTAMGKRQVDAATKPDNGRNSRGKIHVVGGPSGGGYKLRWKGVATATQLAHNASAATIQTALQALSNIGAGNVLVTGSAPDYDYEFAGTLGGIEQERIEVGAVALTGGTAPKVTTEVFTQGGYKEYPTAYVAGAHATIYMATTPEGLDDVANSKLGDLYEWAWGLDEKLDVQDKVDRAENGFSRMVDKPFGSQLSLGVQADVNAQALAVASRNGQGRRYVRIEFISPQEIVEGQTGNPYAFTLDLYGTLKDLGEVTAFGETVGRRFGLDLAYSPSWGRSGRWILRNAVPTA